jgi:hypothetical protein
VANPAKWSSTSDTPDVTLPDATYQQPAKTDKRLIMEKTLSNITLADGSVLEAPDAEGIIRHRDIAGNIDKSYGPADLEYAWLSLNFLESTPECITDAQIAAAQARQDVATPGPWEAIGDVVQTSYIDEGKLPERHRHYGICQVIGDYGLLEEDTAFIANSREDLRRALNEIKRLRSILYIKPSDEAFLVHVTSENGACRSILSVNNTSLDKNLFRRHWREAREAAYVTGDDSDIKAICDILQHRGWNISDVSSITVTL